MWHLPEWMFRRTVEKKEYESVVIQLNHYRSRSLSLTADKDSLAKDVKRIGTELEKEKTKAKSLLRSFEQLKMKLGGIQVDVKDVMQEIDLVFDAYVGADEHDKR